MTAAYSGERWGYNSGSTTVSTIPVTVDTATAGTRLTVSVAIRYLSSSGISSGPTGYTLVQSVDDVIGHLIYERIATGDSNDNFSMTLTAARVVSCDICEWTGLPSTGTVDGYDSDLETTDVLTIAGGSVTPSTQPGIGIAAVAIRDQQDWKTGWSGGQPTGITVDESFNVVWFEMLSQSNAAITAQAYKLFSSTAAMSPSWTGAGSPGSPVASSIIAYLEDTGTSVDVTPPTESLTVTGYAPTIFIQTPAGPMAVENTWRANNGNAVSPSITLNLSSGATAGSKLVAFLVCRFGAQRNATLPSNYDNTGHFVSNVEAPNLNHEAYIFERIATGDSNDDFFFTYDFNRNMALIIFELSNPNATLGYVGLGTAPGSSNGWLNTGTTGPTGAVTPTDAAGIAFALLGVKDKQDWTTGGDNLAGISIGGSYDNAYGSSSGIANTPLAAIAYKNYSDLSQIASATWTNSVGVTDYVFSAVVCYSDSGATEDLDITIPTGGIELTGYAPVSGTAPTVEAGGPYSGDIDTAIALDSTVTPGSDSNPTLLWEIVSGGTGTFSSTSIADPTFTPDVAGLYVLRLTVTPNDADPVFDNASLTSLAADGVWTATNMTTALDAEGLDGIPNTATTLTATAANATIMADAITLPTGNHVSRWFVKRKTGTGPVQITIDGGITWETMAAFSSTVFRQRYVEATIENPQIGARIVTSGDEVIVGNAELNPFTTIADITGAQHIYAFNYPVTMLVDAAQEQTGLWSGENWVTFPINSRFYPIDEGTGSSVADTLGGNTGIIQNFDEAAWGSVPDPGTYKFFVDGVPVASDKSLKVISDTRNNLLALMHMATMSSVEGWAYEKDDGTGTADEPQYLYYKKSARWVQGEMTWSSGAVTQIVWRYSVNSGGAYDTIGTESITYDADGNVETVTWA